MSSYIERIDQVNSLLKEMNCIYKTYFSSNGSISFFKDENGFPVFFDMITQTDNIFLDDDRYIATLLHNRKRPEWANQSFLNKYFIKNNRYSLKSLIRQFLCDLTFFIMTAIPLKNLTTIGKSKKNINILCKAKELGIVSIDGNNILNSLQKDDIKIEVFFNTYIVVAYTHDFTIPLIDRHTSKFYIESQYKKICNNLINFH